KTPADLARQLVAVLVHWFPDRRLILLGDGGYNSHALARFCRRHRRHVTLVALCHARANLYTLPPRRRKGQKGRPRLKGDKGPGPPRVPHDPVLEAEERAATGPVPARAVQPRRPHLPRTEPRPGPRAPD